MQSKNYKSMSYIKLKKWRA